MRIIDKSKAANAFEQIIISFGDIERLKPEEVELVRADLQQPPASAVDVEELKAQIKAALLPKIYPNGAPIYEDKQEWDFCSGIVSGINLTIDHLHQRGLIGQPVGGEDAEKLARSILKDKVGLTIMPTTKTLTMTPESFFECVKSALKHHAGE